MHISLTQCLHVCTHALATTDCVNIFLHLSTPLDVYFSLTNTHLIVCSNVKSIRTTLRQKMHATITNYQYDYTLCNFSIKRKIQTKQEIYMYTIIYISTTHVRAFLSYKCSLLRKRLLVRITMQL